MDPELTKEQKAAQLIQEIEGALKNDFPSLTAKVKAVTEAVEEFKGLDLKKVKEEVDRLKHENDNLVKFFRNRKDGYYIPGAEEKSFSLLKTCIAMNEGGTKRAFEKHDAGHEFEVLHAVQQKYADVHRHFNSKTIIAGDDQLGGAWIPDQVIADVVAPIYRRSMFINAGGEGDTRITVIDGLAGGEVSIPKFLGGSAASWIGEIDKGEETEVQIGTLKFRQRKAGAYLALSQDMIQYPTYGYEAFLRRDLEQSIADLIDETVMYGTGSDHEPRGLANTPGIKVFLAETGVTYADYATARAAVADSDGGELEWTKMELMKLGLKRDNVVIPPNESSWISSPDFFSRLKTRKVDHYSSQSTNQALLIGPPIINDAKLKDMIGDFGETPFIPYGIKPGASLGLTTDSTTLKYTDVVYGSMREIVFGRWGGIEIASDDGKGVGFTREVTLMRVRFRGDIQVRQPRKLTFCPDARAQD